jgi:two-component system phosphate regulon sensor histidine kinase PhoR
VQVDAAADPTFAAAIQGANRTLIIAALGTVALTLGLVLTATAVRTSASLAELRSEFVSTVTHELKTPLATIRLVSDTLASGKIGTVAGQREYARILVQEGKRLTRLIDNLLALSRIADVTDVYSFEPLAVGELVCKAVERFHQQLMESNFEVSTDMPAELSVIRADPDAMELTLGNILDNAIRYSTDTRSLRIAVYEQGNVVMIDVADKGRGIPEDEIGQVTRKFFRGRHAGSGGSGLGLAIVQRVVADHGGRLAIRSALNMGTTVSLSIPILKANDEKTSSRG